MVQRSKLLLEQISSSYLLDLLVTVTAEIHRNAISTEHILDSDGVILLGKAWHVQSSMTQQNLESFLWCYGIKSCFLATHNANCLEASNVQLTVCLLTQPSYEGFKESLKHSYTNYNHPSLRSGRIFSNRIQSNDYFEVIGVTDYRCQKVIVTKYPDPDAVD